MSENKRYIISFENTHFVIKAELKMKKHFSTATTIPTPEELSSDCGISLEIISEKSADQISELLKKEGLSFRNILKC